jgi:hypothetical protein
LESPQTVWELFALPASKPNAINMEMLIKSYLTMVWRYFPALVKVEKFREERRSQMAAARSLRWKPTNNHVVRQIYEKQ